MVTGPRQDFRAWEPTLLWKHCSKCLEQSFDRSRLVNWDAPANSFEISRHHELRAQKRETGFTFVVLVRGTTCEGGDWHLAIAIWSSTALGRLIARALLRVDRRRYLPIYTPLHNRVELQRL